MAGVSMELVTNAKSVQTMLARLETALSAQMLGSVFLKGTVVRQLRSRARGRFASGGDDASGKWRALAPTTLDIRESQGFGPTPINVRTGELERYITTGAGTVVGTTLIYPGQSPGNGESGYLEKKVITAQRGWSSPATPARPVLAVSEEDLALTLTALRTYIESYVAGYVL